MLTEYDFDPDPAPHPENPEDKWLLAATVAILAGVSVFLVWQGWPV